MDIGEALEIVTPQTFSSQVNPATKIAALEKQMGALLGRIMTQGSTINGLQRTLGLAFKRIEALEAKIAPPDPTKKTKKRR